MAVVGTAPLRGRQRGAVVPADAAQGHNGARRPFQLRPGPPRWDGFGSSIADAPHCLLWGREDKHFQRAEGEHDWSVSKAGPCALALDSSPGGNSLKRTELSALLDDRHSLALPHRSCGVLRSGTYPRKTHPAQRRGASAARNRRTAGVGVGTRVRMDTRIRMWPRMMSPGVVSRGSGSDARNRDKTSNAPFMVRDRAVMRVMAIACRSRRW